MVKQQLARAVAAAIAAMGLVAGQAAWGGPVEELQAWLAKPAAERGEIGKQGFATAPLTKAEAERAKDLLWADYAARRMEEAKKTVAGEPLRLGDKEMKFKIQRYGKKPEKGWALWISMHGGGSAPAQVNDQQWSNQHRLYTMEDSIVVAPRAPTDAWNMWHESHIDDFFDRLIEDYVIAGEVDPNRVYLVGYSAGGDGVYQLAPRMADRFAAAGMMAGHPNDASPLGLRNLPFALHVGANDAAYKRNQVAAEWGKKLDELQASDPEGYKHHFELHKDRGHWMNKEEEKTAIPWMRAFERNPWPKKVVWKQSPRQHDRLYWLGGEAKPGAEVVASVNGQTITIEKAEGWSLPALVLDDELVNLDQPVLIRHGTSEMRVEPKRTIEALSGSLESRGDRRLMASAVVPMPFVLGIMKLGATNGGGTVNGVPFTVQEKKESEAVQKTLAYVKANLAPGDVGKVSEVFLRRDAERAVAAREKYPWGKTVPEEVFLEYVAAYRNFDEPFEDWRLAMEAIAAPIVAGETAMGKAALKLNRELFKKVNVQYHPTKRPRPNQSPAESMKAGYASCSGLSILLVDACRAVGIPARVVGTPEWAIKKGDINGNHGGNHTWVEVWDGTQWRFIGAAEDGEFDKTWFNDNASRASARYPIFAAAFTRSPGMTWFPMVWNMADHSVPAVDVTDYYANRVQLQVSAPVGETVELRDPALGNRLVARFTGTATLALAGGRKYEATAGGKTQTVTLTNDKTQTVELAK